MQGNLKFSREFAGSRVFPSYLFAAWDFILTEIFEKIFMLWDPGISGPPILVSLLPGVSFLQEKFSNFFLKTLASITALDLGHARVLFTQTCSQQLNAFSLSFSSLPNLILFHPSLSLDHCYLRVAIPTLQPSSPHRFVWFSLPHLHHPASFPSAPYDAI